MSAIFTRLSVEQEWEQYRDTVYPDGISAVQNKECRAAFVGGMMMALRQLQAASALEPMERAEAEVKGLVDEAATYEFTG